MSKSKGCCGNRAVRVFDTSAELLSELAKIIEKIADQAIKTKRVFNIAVSGGSQPTQLASCLGEIKTDWKKWRIFFCDERLVPSDNEDSTYGAYLKAFENVIPITAQQFIPVNTNLSESQAALDYARKLRSKLPGLRIPKFDLQLLGLGEDGHTCSLFPDHSLLDEKRKLVAPITDSPKSPPVRVTLTYPVLNLSQSIFIVIGSSKADAVKRILQDNESLPAGRVQPTRPNKVIWLIDSEAASLLENPEECQSTEAAAETVELTSAETTEEPADAELIEDIGDVEIETEVVEADAEQTEIGDSGEAAEEVASTGTEPVSGDAPAAAATAESAEPAEQAQDAAAVVETTESAITDDITTTAATEESTGTETATSETLVGSITNLV